MARTVTEIKKQITDTWMSDENIQQKYELDTSKTFEQQFSKVSLESILFYVVALGHWILENLFDTHTAQVDDKIRNERVQTIGWIRTMALNFQYGGVFYEDITAYDNTGLTDEEIQEQKIITKCSVSKAERDKPTLVVKVAKDSGKLSDVEKEAFTAYMDAIINPGIEIIIVSEDADKLILYMTVLFDSMVLNSNGETSDGEKPINEGVVEHLNNLVFNGEFYPPMLQNYLMEKRGISSVRIRQAQVFVGGTYVDISDKYTPVSGAIEIDIINDLHVTYERF